MARPALGGIGLHLNGALFGVLHGGLVYLKVDKGLREEYHAAGMRPLEPRPKQKLDAFLEVPQEVVGDDVRLLEHAARSAGRPVPKPAAAAPRRSRAKSTASATQTEAPAAAEEPAKPAKPTKPQASAKPSRTERGKAEKTSS